MPAPIDGGFVHGSSVPVLRGHGHGDGETPPGLDPPSRPHVVEPPHPSGTGAPLAVHERFRNHRFVVAERRVRWVDRELRGKSVGLGGSMNESLRVPSPGQARGALGAAAMCVTGGEHRDSGIMVPGVRCCDPREEQPAKRDRSGDIGEAPWAPDGRHLAQPLAIAYEGRHPAALTSLRTALALVKRRCGHAGAPLSGSLHLNMRRKTAAIKSPTEKPMQPPI